MLLEQSILVIDVHPVMSRAVMLLYAHVNSVRETHPEALTAVMELKPNVLQSKDFSEAQSLISMEVNGLKAKLRSLSLVHPLTLRWAILLCVHDNVDRCVDLDIVRVSIRLLSQATDTK